MKNIRRFVGVAMLGAVLTPCARAQKVEADKDGGLYFTDAAGQRAQLAKGSTNSDPCLDPAKRRIAFVRATPGQTAAAGNGEVDASELCVVNTDGSHLTVLLHGATSQDPKQTLGDFSTPCFSSDGGTLYFVSAAWAVSGAVHSYHFSTKKVGYLFPGNNLEAVLSGKYTGDFLVQQHRYFLGGGSYDWFWLLKPDGTEVGPVGETTDVFKANCEEPPK